MTNNSLTPTYLVPREQWGTLLITGPDRLSWLNGVVTCDVKALTGEVGVWGLALDRKGKIQSEVWCVDDGTRLLVATSAGRAAAVREHLDAMLIMEDAELEDVSQQFTWFEVIGPDAQQCISSMSVALGVSAPLDRTSLGGALLCVPHEAAAEVLLSWTGPSPLVGQEWLAFRLERLLPEYGTDFDSKARPHDASLERRAVSWSKGCYLGQEVVCMQDMRGKVRHHLVVATTEPSGPPIEVGASVVDASGHGVGSVRSCVLGRVEGRASGKWLMMLDLETAAELSGGSLALDSGAPLAILSEPI